MFYKVAFIFWHTSVAGVGCGCVKCNPRGSGAACIIARSAGFALKFIQALLCTLMKCAAQKYGLLLH